MEASAAYEYLPKPTDVTADYMREVMDQYYMRKWNPNKDTVISVKSWRDWPMIVRMPDLQKDFTVMIDEGRVLSVTPGLAENPRILTIMLSETMQRIYYDESTAAIELIAGRIKVRGNETERRRMLAAISYLTW
ncbi:MULTISPECIES: hypothetical protein [unclassified Hyphomicrobium]|uniref:hypothetical protein n=1 Tax=unclassified Hyphomicrobium TaxID=2619925 RepID=UPI000213F84C|nr:MULTISPECIES: hypothetical protein [unclassified Hyphomicrobium]CCB63423.1 protein of unknown function [Hyphomicrobium sp. MC1]